MSPEFKKMLASLPPYDKLPLVRRGVLQSPVFKI
jgi:hypothetical protein